MVWCGSILACNSNTPRAHRCPFPFQRRHHRRCCCCCPSLQTRCLQCRTARRLEGVAAARRLRSQAFDLPHHSCCCHHRRALAASSNRCRLLLRQRCGLHKCSHHGVGHAGLIFRTCRHDDSSKCAHVSLTEVACYRNREDTSRGCVCRPLLGGSVHPISVLEFNNTRFG